MISFCSPRVLLLDYTSNTLCISMNSFCPTSMMGKFQRFPEFYDRLGPAELPQLNLINRCVISMRLISIDLNQFIIGSHTDPQWAMVP